MSEFGSSAGSRWERLNSSFWFIPALLTAGGVVLASITQPLDWLLQGVLDSLPTVISGGAAGAGSVLTAISGSLITVIATVFSLTIVALTLASGQYSPRLMRSFVSDRGLQVVLGTYIGTFVYSLIVLRLVSMSEDQTTGFNPVISLAVDLLLALVCVALLIYFINHVAQMIQSSSIVQMAHDDTMEIIDKLDDLDGSPTEPKDPEEHPGWRDLLVEAPSMVRARESGYIQNLNVESILDAVVVDERIKVVEIPLGPGNFVAARLPVVRLWPAVEGGLGSDVERAVNKRLRQ